MNKKLLGILLGAGALAFLGYRAKASQPKQTIKTCYDVTIDWGVRYPIKFVQHPLCQYDNQNYALLQVAMGYLGWVKPRIGIWKASKHDGSGWNVKSLLVDLTKHTQRTNEPLYGKRTTFTITCTSNGCYVDGKKICSESQPNLNFPSILGFRATYNTRKC